MACASVAVAGVSAFQQAAAASSSSSTFGKVTIRFSLSLLSFESAGVMCRSVAGILECSIGFQVLQSSLQISSCFLYWMLALC